MLKDVLTDLKPSMKTTFEESFEMVKEFYIDKALGHKIDAGIVITSGVVIFKSTDTLFNLSGTNVKDNKVIGSGYYAILRDDGLMSIYFQQKTLKFLGDDSNWEYTFTLKSSDLNINS